MARFYVDCPDGQVRHARPFSDEDSARQWADSGHHCPSAKQHDIELHVDVCECDWCNQEREQDR